MARCIVITAYIEGTIKENIDIQEDDFVICADAGYLYARNEGIKVDLLIGDFDSLDEESVLDDIEIIRLSVEKDDTDTLYSLKYGLEIGYDDFVIIGGLGGRIDHTISNFQSMSLLCELGKKVTMLDDKHYVTMIKDSNASIEGKEGSILSVFAFSDTCIGVNIEGAKYGIKDFKLTNSFPIGVSNEIDSKRVNISCEKGTLLIMAIDKN